MDSPLGRQRLAWLADHIAGTGERVEVTAQASPGPWWGFNGVHTLAVTQRRLWMVHSTLLTCDSGKGRARVLASVVALSDLESVTGGRRAGLFAQPEVWQVRLRAKDWTRDRRYTFEDARAGARLVDAVRRSSA